jgi:hypothetical protein
MKPFLIVVFVCVILNDVFSQESLILRDVSGYPTDTLGAGSLFFIRNDTLTRFVISKGSSPDHCSTFSIARGRYLKGDDGFRQLGIKTIVIGSKCSSLWSEDKIYCLRLEKFKISKYTVSLTITDSNDQKLRARLKGGNDFETQLKDKVDNFINSVDCNGVTVE